MASLLDQLKSMTVVVADTGDINSIEKFKPRDTTTNPSLIAQAAGMPEYAKVIDQLADELDLGLALADLVLRDARGLLDFVCPEA